MPKYDIDFKHLAVSLLPPKLRNAGMMAAVKALVMPLVFVLNSFRRFRSDNLYKLANNSQVCYLTKVLNDYFDSDARSIRIEDANLITRTYAYTPGEERPLYLGTKYLYSNTALNGAAGFVVIAPERLNTPAELAVMRNLINTYKLAGTRYIITFE